MNSDEAKRCIQLGIQAMKQNDYQKAIRLFQKSNRLHQSSQAKTYLAQARKDLNKPQQESKPSLPSYKPQDAQLARQILSKKDFYDILSVPKTATTDEIKRSYKKLALKLHPDKNKAPNAEQAFKRVSRAYSALENPQKRELYDRTGSDEPQQAVNMNFDDISPFDLFQQVINNGYFHGQRVYRRQPRQTPQQANGVNYWAIFQLLPIFLLFMISFIQSVNTVPPPYSLYRTSYHNIEKVTQNMQVSYWLQASFARDMTRKMKIQLQTLVEQHFILLLKNECSSQMKKKQNLLKKSKTQFTKAQSKAYQQSAEQVDLTACEEYSKITQYKTQTKKFDQNFWENLPRKTQVNYQISQVHIQIYASFFQNYRRLHSSEVDRRRNFRQSQTRNPLKDPPKSSNKNPLKEKNL